MKVCCDGDIYKVAGVKGEGVPTYAVLSGFVEEEKIRPEG